MCQRITSINHRMPMVSKDHYKMQILYYYFICPIKIPYDSRRGLERIRSLSQRTRRRFCLALSRISSAAWINRYNWPLVQTHHQLLHYSPLLKTVTRNSKLSRPSDLFSANYSRRRCVINKPCLMITQRMIQRKACP